MLRFIEGFEIVPNSMLNTKWSVVNLTNPTYVAGRTPYTRALQFTGTALTSYPFSNAPTYVVGFAFNWTGFTSSPTIFQFLYNSDVQISLVFNLGRQTMQVVSGATVLGVGNTILAPNQWNYVELKATIDPTAGSYTLNINGITDISASNVNTCGSPSDGDAINTISFQGASVGSYLLDDIYLLDTTGSVNNNFLGNMTVQALSVSHEGDYSQWTPYVGINPSTTTPNWQATAAVDTSRVLSQTVGAEDTYGISRLKAISTTVSGISLHYFGRNDGVGNHSITPIVRIGGVDYAQTSQSFTTSQSLQLLTQIMDENPATSAPWVVSDFNTMQVGMKLAS